MNREFKNIAEIMEFAENLDGEYKFIATDSDQEVFAYRTRPVLCEKMWESSTFTHPWDAGIMSIGYYTGEVEWVDSLREIRKS